MGYTSGCHPQAEERSGGSLWVSLSMNLHSPLNQVISFVPRDDEPCEFSCAWSNAAGGHRRQPNAGVHTPERRWRDARAQCFMIARKTPPSMHTKPRCTRHRVAREIGRLCRRERRTRKPTSGCHPQAEERSGGSLWVSLSRNLHSPLNQVISFVPRDDEPCEFSCAWSNAAGGHRR